MGKKTNPLLRTPRRELRRHIVEVGATTLVLVTVVGGMTTRAGSGNDPASSATASPTSADTEAMATPDPAAPTMMARTQTAQCDKACTLVVTAAGGSDVRLTVNGSLTDSQPLGASPTSSTVKVTGTGAIQAAATAADWVELSVTNETGQQQ